MPAFTSLGGVDPPCRLSLVVDVEPQRVESLGPEQLPWLGSLTLVETALGPAGGRGAERAVPVEDEDGSAWVGSLLRADGGTIAGRRAGRGLDLGGRRGPQARRTLSSVPGPRVA